MTARSRRPFALAACIADGVTRAEEVLTVVELAPLCKVSVSTLKRRCRELGTTALKCLYFIWCARAVASKTRVWDPDAELTPCCADPRTRRRLIQQGGLGGPVQPTLAQFLERQRILTTPTLLAELRVALQGAITGFAVLVAELSDTAMTVVVATL